MRVPDATTLELREVSRCYDDLQADLRRLSNRLWEQLQRYFPQLLELCPGADAPWFWDLLELASHPERAATLPKRRVTTLLAHHRKRALAADDVITLLRTPPLTLAPGSQEAALFHVALLLPQLRVAHAERRRCEQRLAQLMGQAGRTAEIVDSHNGAGPIVTAKLLAEASQALAERDLEGLRRVRSTPLTSTTKCVSSTSPGSSTSNGAIHVCIRGGANCSTRSSPRRRSSLDPRAGSLDAYRRSTATSTSPRISAPSATTLERERSSHRIMRRSLPDSSCENSPLLRSADGGPTLSISPLPRHPHRPLHVSADSYAVSSRPPRWTVVRDVETVARCSTPPSRGPHAVAYRTSSPRTELGQ